MKTINTHKTTWDEPETPSPELLVYVAQRPLIGEHTWEGANRYGIHYAAISETHTRFAEWHMMNYRNDARLVRLVDNAGSLAIAAGLAASRNSYSLAAYLREMPGHDGAREFCRVYELPWHDSDTSADAMIAAASE